ncbi:MAG: ROK family protein [Angustibacter sp.]
MGAGLVAGVDVGGTKVLAVVADERLRVLGRARLRTRQGERGVVDTVVRAVTEAAHQAGVAPGALGGIGVGVPGLVDAAAGRVSHAVNLGLHQPTELAAGLRERLGVPVVVENDVNAAALGAHVLRPVAGDLALLSIGTGLAAGLVLGGRLHRGARGAAGEIGHVPVDPAGAPCSCGQRGCLETVASGAALAGAWAPGAGQPSTSAWQAAAAGDEAAAAAVHRFSAGVAAAVRLLVLTWDVETVVLAGGVTEVGRPLLEAVRAALRAQEATAPLMAALGLSGRVELLGRRAPVAALGAAWVACGRLVDDRPSAQEVS